MNLNLHRYRFPTALLLAISMALAPGLTEAKKNDDKNHKKSNAHRVEKRSAPVAQRSAPSRANVQRHVASANRSRSAPKPKAQAVARHSSNDRKPQQRVVANRSASNHGRHAVAAASHSRSNAHKPTRQQAIAATRDRKPDHSRNLASSNHTRNLQVAKNHRNDSARERRVVNRPRVLAASHRDHSDARTRAARSAAIATASRRHDIRRDDGHRHSNVAHRDRSNYNRRHDHHSHDWYVNNGWSYDRDYYTANHAHRYYNDYDRTYIIEVNGPGYSYPAYPAISNGYGYGYAEPAPAPAYRDYGSDYDYTTRVLVQQQLSDAGYYNGAMDGDIGPGTRSAIAEYQYDAQLPTTGVIDEQLLDSLGIQ